MKKESIITNHYQERYNTKKRHDHILIEENKKDTTMIVNQDSIKCKENKHNKELIPIVDEIKNNPILNNNENRI